MFNDMVKTGSLKFDIINLIRKFMYPYKDQLEKKWWHRLLKVIFIVLSIIILIVSFAIFYSQEHGSTSKYELIKNFKTFIEEAKLGQTISDSKHLSQQQIQEMDKITGLGDKNIGTQTAEEFNRRYPVGTTLSAEDFAVKYGGKMLVVESFLSAYSLKGELGCLTTNSRVTILPEYDFRRIDCDLDRTVVCNIPQDVCEGDASRIIKYKGDVQYTITNYFSILTKVLLVLIAWGTTCYILYYKMFLYVIFGKEPLKYSKN